MIKRLSSLPSSERYVPSSNLKRSVSLPTEEVYENENNKIK